MFISGYSFYLTMLYDTYNNDTKLDYESYLWIICIVYIMLRVTIPLIFTWEVLWIVDDRVKKVIFFVFYKSAFYRSTFYKSSPVREIQHAKHYYFN